MYYIVLTHYEICFPHTKVDATQGTVIRRKNRDDWTWSWLSSLIHVMRISGINQYTHDEVYLSYLQVLPNYTHIKKRKVLDIDVRHIVILDSGYIKKNHTLKFISTVTLYLKVKSPLSCTDRIVAFIAILKVITLDF